MGPRWGGWYALNYLQREGLDTKSVVGEHVTGNAERGIQLALRREPDGLRRHRLQGTLAAGNPGSDSATGVRMADFEQVCDIPASQGAGGRVTALPESFADGQHKVAVKGEGLNAPHDIDLYCYDATCARTGSAASSAADESSSLPSGTGYVVTQLWSGAKTSFSLLAEDTA